MKPAARKPIWSSIVVAAIALYLFVLLAQIVKRNYDLQHQVVDLQQQIDSLQVQKDELSYKIQYYQTDSFKDKEARAKLGLQAPGENVIILPKTASQPTAPAKPAKPKSNWQQWMQFLFGP